MSIHASIHMSIHMFIHLSTHMPIHVSIQIRHHHDTGTIRQHHDSDDTSTIRHHHGTCIIRQQHNIGTIRQQHDTGTIRLVTAFNAKYLIVGPPRRRHCFASGCIKLHRYCDEACIKNSPGQQYYAGTISETKDEEAKEEKEVCSEETKTTFSLICKVASSDSTTTDNSNTGIPIKPYAYPSNNAEQHGPGADAQAEDPRPADHSGLAVCHFNGWGRAVDEQSRQDRH